MTDAARYDLMIVGAGLVGLSLAAIVGRQGFSVAVIEAREPQVSWPQDSVDLRVYAISRASEKLLVEADAWQAIAPYACAYTDMHVWDAGGSGDIHFDSAELGEPNLGHIIESRVIEKALLDAIATLPGVELLCPVSVKTMFAGEDCQIVELEDGRQLSSQLLVGADGKQSRVRDYAGIHAIASDYGQQALVVVVETERGHDDTAWQRFLATGPLAFLPLKDGRSSIVWSATTETAEQLISLDDDAFCEALSEAFDFRLGRVVSCGERVLFPLVRQHAERVVAEQIALVGDAAHVIHPLAGQGVNLGLKDVRELADVLLAARRQGKGIGGYSVLRRYERARKGDNMATMMAMDGFKHLFGTTSTPLRVLRNAGLNLVDAAGPVKNAIIRSAMGL